MHGQQNIEFLFTFLLPHVCPVTNVFVLLPVVTLVTVLWCF